MPDFPVRTTAILNNIEVTITNVKDRLQKLNENKSHGFDEINPRALKNCANAFSKPIHKIITESLEKGVVPNEWKCANISPIHKKGPEMDPGNYRPVSLTSVVCKVMEGIVGDAVMKHMVSNNLLSDKQHGFVHKRACNTNLLAGQDIISKAINDYGAADTIYTDFAKAFDTVSHKLLIHKLKAYGIRGATLAWIEEFLRNRKQRVVMGETVSVGAGSITFHHIHK